MSRGRSDVTPGCCSSSIAAIASGSRSRFEVHWSNERVELTRSELLVLGALVRQRGFVLSRDRLLDLARGGDVVVTDRTVDTFIKRIRKKVKAVDEGFDEIETVIGVGYKYRA